LPPALWNRKKKSPGTGITASRIPRPLVFIDPENGWNEIITQDIILCENPLYRIWEMYLRKEIHWGSVLKNDKVIRAKFPATYDYSDSGWGLSGEKIKSDAALGAYTWEAPVKGFGVSLGR